MQPLLQEKFILIYFKFIFVFVLFSKNTLIIKSFIFKTEKKVLKNDRKLKILYVKRQFVCFTVFNKEMINSSKKTHFKTVLPLQMNRKDLTYKKSGCLCELTSYVIVA